MSEREHRGRPIDDGKDEAAGGWAPPRFRLEPTTLWSFPERGSWAGHEGGYRGNWSPYIPRNLILRYTRPGELVLDPFVGGGTTAIEAKLLGRRCLALDRNPAAIARSRDRLRLEPPVFAAEIVHAPGLLVGDARTLPVASGSIDLICAHPPYADIIPYSNGLSGDLSQLPVEAFVEQLGSVAAECLRVLRPGGVCAVLIGDLRRRGAVVPLGFETLGRFRAAGFLTKEIVIKAQHNTRTAASWAPRAAERGFLLLAHEYLFVLSKPAHQGPGRDTRPGHRIDDIKRGSAIQGHAEFTSQGEQRMVSERATADFPD